MPTLRISKDSPEGYDKSLTWKDFDKPVELVINLKSLYDEFCMEVNNVLSTLSTDLFTYLKANG